MQIIKTASDIEFYAGPAVLTARGQPVVQGLQCSPHIGLFQGALPHSHQCITLLSAGSEDAPGAMILEAAPYHPHPISQ